MIVDYYILEEDGFHKNGVFYVKDGKAMFRNFLDGRVFSDAEFVMCFGDKYYDADLGEILLSDAEEYIHGLPKRFRGYAQATFGKGQG